VATDTSGPGEIVRDFKKRRDGCGIVIPSRFNDFHGDSKKAAAAMKKGILEMASLMEDPGKRASLRRNARKRAAEFDMESSTKNLLRIYRSAGKI
jgi:glycosyltransferase involved in cell wall biosynthesis